MKKYFLAATLLLGALTMSAADYTHSIGGVVGSMYGVSYKGFIFGVDGLALQADLGVQLMSTAGSTSYVEKYDGTKVSDADGNLRKLPVFTFVANPNVLYQSNVASWGFGSLDWYAGGGLSIGLMKQNGTGFEEKHNNSWYSYPSAYAFADADGKADPVLGKFGVNAVAGVELGLSSVPLAISFDFRPGYGLGFYSGKNSNDSKWTTSETFNFFDWTLAVGVRYCF